ncbi:MAG: 2TM domain-containing protein [Symploca sp. SIO2E9]|nr:2TM domain-containing protein [Symploca sp. SIO2E9]
MSVPETKISRSYHQEDIQQILNLAIARQVDGGEFSREQLVEMASELGITSDTLLEAEQEWLLQQQEQQQRDQFNIYRRSKLRQSIGKYLITNSFLVVLNFLTAGHLSWSLYILLVWGLGLALQVWNNYQLHGEEYEQAFQKWNRRQQLAQAAQSVFTRINNWLKDNAKREQ